MSKREAADYITKDGRGSMSAPPDHVPRTATAAQMAQRKLKAPRGRLHSGVSTTGSQSFLGGTAPNLFGQIGGGNNQFSAPSGSNNSTPAFNFSTSASFPPSRPSTVNFTAAPPSGSFTFAPQTASNPFSGFGESTGNTGANNINFGGFGAQPNGAVTNSQSDGDTMMESPQKKPPAFGTTFSTGGTATPSAATFSFGEPSHSGPPSGFGTLAPAKPSNSTFNFGQSQPAAQTGSLFGFVVQKPEEPKPQTSLFGQSLNTSQPAAANAPSSNSLFSQSNSTFNPPLNPFGQTSAISTNPGNTSGSSTPATQPSTGGPFSTIFGQAPATTNPSIDAQTSSEVPKPAFSFASSTTQPGFSFSAAPVSNSNTASSKLTLQAPELTSVSLAADATGPILFEGPTSSSFGDLFKANANARLASPATTATSTGAVSAESNPFTFKPNPQSSQPEFSGKGGSFGFKPSESNTASLLFGTATRPEEPASITAERATLEKPTQDGKQSYSTSNNTMEDINVFGKASKPEQAPQPAVESIEPLGTSNLFLKGFQSQPKTQQSALPSKTSFGSSFSYSSNEDLAAVQQEKRPLNNSLDNSLFARASAADSQNGSSRPAESQVKQPSRLATKPNPLPAKSSSTSGLLPSTSPGAPTTSKSIPATSKAAASAISKSDVRLRSYGSSAIPGYLDSDESVEHDGLSRLRNLNTSFQKNITKLDPAADDFEEIIRHYVAQRARIGHSLNLKERNKAGMKRKMNNGEAIEEPFKGLKKARTESTSADSINSGMPSATTENSNSSAIVQPPDTVTNQLVFQTTTQAGNGGSSSATSSIFKHMMSSPAPGSLALPSMSGTSQLPGNPFASVKASSPSSDVLTSRAEAPALSSGTAKENMQSKTPFALLGASSSTNSDSVSVVSSTPLTKTQPPSTTPAKSPPKKPVFEVPQFGTSSSTSFMDAFAQQSAKSAAELQEEAKRKRKAEDFDSDEDDEAEWERKYEEDERAKRNKLESLSKSGTTGFQPLFGGKETSATAKTFFNLASNETSNTRSSPEKGISSIAFAGFGSTGTSGKSAKELVTMADEDSNGSRSSEGHAESVSHESSDQSSEENMVDEEDASRGDHEQEEDEEESGEHDHEDESEDEDIQAAMARTRSKGSLFDRIEPNPKLKLNDVSKKGGENLQKKPNGIFATSLEAQVISNGPQALQAAVNSSSKRPGANGVLDSDPFTSTRNAPAMSSFAPTNGSGPDPKDLFAPAKSVFVTSKKADVEDASSSKKTSGERFFPAPNISAPAPSPARSVLFGGNTTFTSGAIPGEGLFGSRPSTPSHEEPSRGNLFGNLGSFPNFSNSQTDKTYQRGTPLKFGTPDKEGPTVNITAATPPAKDGSSATSKSFADLFGSKPTKPGADALASVGFNFGGPTHLTASPLLDPSALSSAVSSRATSPGATDTESVNTDFAEEHSDEPQTSLMSSRPGEENEEVLFEGRSKALKLITEEVAREKKLEPGFNTQGVGQLRVLKHKTTRKTRLLLRAEPGSNIVINTALTPSMTYKATETKGSGAVKFGVPTATGIDHWVAKVKTAAMAEELAGILEANKGEPVQK